MLVKHSQLIICLCIIISACTGAWTFGDKQDVVVAGLDVTGAIHEIQIVRIVSDGGGNAIAMPKGFMLRHTLAASKGDRFHVEVVRKGSSKVFRSEKIEIVEQRQFVPIDVSFGSIENRVYPDPFPHSSPNAILIPRNICSDSIVWAEFHLPNSSNSVRRIIAENCRVEGLSFLSEQYTVLVYSIKDHVKLRGVGSFRPRRVADGESRPISIRWLD